nr:MAG TPA: hypothetical protein [Caudoviricetes sp.]
MVVYGDSIYLKIFSLQFLCQQKCILCQRCRMQKKDYTSYILSSTTEVL